MHRLVVGLWLSAVGSLGCQGEDTIQYVAPDETLDAANTGNTGDTTHSAETANTPPGAEPSFWQDVAPILNEKCTACHQAGGIAPFALDNYDDAEKRAALIADMTANRIMPPYLMEVGGECGTFDERAALTSAEIDTIGAWARGAKTEGTPTTLTPGVLPTLAEGTDYQTPNFSPVIQGGVLAQFDEYRCFQLDLGLNDDTFVTGFEITPGNKQMVHHVIAMLVDPNADAALAGFTNAQVIQRLHDASPERDGWPCFSQAGEGVQVESASAAWAPGGEPFQFPEGVGVRVRKDRVLVVQVHYNLANPEVRGGSDQTRVRLRYADDVERQAALLLNDAFLRTLRNPVPDMLEPGNPAVPYSWTLTGAAMGIPPGVSADLLTVAPHMHQRGRKYTLELGRDGVFECQGRVHRWDFNWQRSYFYMQPPSIDADTQIRVSCEYDTSGDTMPVLPGWGTRNEMCEVTMFVAFPAGVTF